ncbi:hypothetical protein ACONUD_01220 [Microbulbifer harenosus]|uniref:Uncharacterized protein n=1 Tax=Microbulbifer harenosus TaxID=2576840 RepID=A0ABY2UM25_9GAMM|nr:hypothetical protein [Microbulbifer harenosus]TLM79523.1 hypothetical protein FDY93_01210 [Microbulbifer harenosus]
MQGETKTWKLIIGRGQHNVSRSVYILHTQEKNWQQILRNQHNSYYLASIARAVYALGGIAVGRKLRREKLIFDGAAIHYELDTDGDVLIMGLEVNSSYNPKRGQQTTGLYQVDCSAARDRDFEWSTRDKAKTKMTLSHRWNKSHYAAVSGKFESKEDAGSMLINHISNAYKAGIKEHDINRQGNHYSLYWQNGNHKSDKQRDHLVSLIQQAVASGARVNWLVHGEGATTFVRAMHALEKRLSPAPVAPAREKELRENLKLQTVYFSNPRGKETGKNTLEALSKKVGFDYLGTNINPGDVFHNPDARSAAFGKGGAVIGAITLSGAAGTLGADDILKSFTQAVNAETLGWSAATLVAGYFVVRDKIKTNSGYARNLPGFISSTFGDGNQRWVG